MTQEPRKPPIASQVTTYEYDKAAITQLFANHLEVPVEQVTLSFNKREVGDDRFSSGPPQYEIVGVSVSVKNK